MSTSIGRHGGEPKMRTPRREFSGLRSGVDLRETQIDRHDSNIETASPFEVKKGIEAKDLKTLDQLFKEAKDEEELRAVVEANRHLIPSAKERAKNLGPLVNRLLDKYTPEELKALFGIEPGAGGDPGRVE